MAANEKIKVDLSAAPDPTPKPGDTVNYVAPSSHKIAPVKVVEVPGDTGGRVVMINQGTEAKSKLVRVTHRPKESLGGNTWHWPAKVAALLGVALLLGLNVALANLPTYRTFSAYGNPAATVTLIMPADPRSQIRVVSAAYTSDTNNTTLSFASGTTAYSLTVSNAATSSITNLINSTNGLAANNWLVLQHLGSCYTNYVVSWGTYATGTNSFGSVTNQSFVVTGTGGFGVYGYVNDEIYLMGPVSTYYIGSGTNFLNGDDIYSGNFGRPVWMQLSTPLVTNRLSSVSCHYDQ